MKAYDFERFLEAQQNTYCTALAEIKSGGKRSHWMWYIFPQLKGLGQSATSQLYGINGLAEAKAYLEHPVLGSRLVEISNALLGLESNDALRVMGSPDHLKLRSSMTLFASVPGADRVIEEVLEKFFNGQKDPKTLELLKK